VSNDSDDTLRAFIAALEALYVQYPVKDRSYISARSQRIWRDKALEQAASGSINLALIWVKDTGIPEDVLDGLRALLDE
jgi:hypothetical protein